MDTLEIFKKYDGKTLAGYPEIAYSNLYRKVLDNCYLEFLSEDEKYLYSPNYSLIRGYAVPGVTDFVSHNEVLFSSLKRY
ncbi:MAG: hypothetical protein L0Y73_02055, partial [Candidatus Aminicenantes bacterium]|nr:hypothetical protein [Candidatus Aminicenantes bacterium]